MEVSIPTHILFKQMQAKNTDPAPEAENCTIVQLVVKEKPVAEKATADMTKYMQEYRKKNLDKLRNYDRCKYIKRKAGLTKDFQQKFGDATADAGRIFSYYKLFVSLYPDHKQTLLQELATVKS